MTKFELYWKTLTTEEKRDLAQRLGTSTIYLTMIAQRKRNAGAKILMAIKKETGGIISPEEIRR